MSGAPRPVFLPNNIGGLTGWWTFDGHTMDCSGNGNTGILEGSPSYVGGKINQAISLVGTSSQFVETTTNFGNGESLNKLTLTCWFNTAAKGGQSIIGVNASKDGSSTTNDRTIYVGTDGKVRGYAYSPASAYNVVSSGATTYNDSAWHHAALVIVFGGVLALYVDGALAQSISLGSNLYNNGANSYWIMGRNGANSGTDSAAGYFTGSIDDVRIYNRALSAGEILAIYNEAATASQ